MLTMYFAPSFAVSARILVSLLSAFVVLLEQSFPTRCAVGGTQAKYIILDQQKKRNDEYELLMKMIGPEEPMVPCV
jgi:hypothetical protein